MIETLEIFRNETTVLQNIEVVRSLIENQKSGFAPGQSLYELYYLCLGTSISRNFNLDIAEVGVYSGGSASFINRMKDPNQKLYLIDTFEGLKDCQEQDQGGRVWNGLADSLKELNVTFEDVKSRFDGENVEFIKGYFPECAPAEFENKTFGFVHLDVDTYLSTLNCLNYFYPKMIDGGVIVVHDYINEHAPGVSKSVDEFVQATGAGIMIPRVGTTQAIIFK